MLCANYARRACVLIGALGVLVLAAPLPAAASVAPPSISIAPVGVTGAYFNETIAAGETLGLAVELANTGGSAVRARTYAADVYSIHNGGFGARLSTDPRTGATNWVSYPATPITLAAGASLRRTFTISVPAHASAGEHVTSLVVERDANHTNGGAVSVNQVIRQAVPVVINVPGPRTPGLVADGAIHATVGGRTVVSIGVTNTGNMRTHPAGRVEVSDATGQQIIAADVKMGTVYPEDSTTTEVALTSLLAAGGYSVALVLGDAASHIADRSYNFAFTVVPAEASATVPAAPGDRQVGPVGDARTRTTIPTMMILGLVGGSLLAGAAMTVVALRVRRRRHV